MIITSKNWNILLYFIICTLAYHEVVSQGFQEVSTPRPRTCRTAARKLGKCVHPRKCEPVMKLLRENASLGQLALNQLRCPGSYEHFQICCPNSAQKTPLQPEKPSNTDSHSKNQALLPPQCGVSNARHDRVVGGNIAELGAWPWLGLLGYGSRSGNSISFKCGGTLISSRAVVTAAHCVYGHSDLWLVRLGEHDLQSDSDGARPRDYVIRKKIAHPNYNPDTSENDIAILKLDEEVPFTDLVHPICLPVTDELKNRDFVRNLPFVAGWGATAWKGSASTTLLEAQVPVVDSDTCAKQYQPVKNVVIDSRVVCAGYAQGGIDACQGDSGGPLMLPVQKSFYLIGVVSGGYKCAEPGFSGIYTRVTAFLDFILRYVD